VSDDDRTPPQDPALENEIGVSVGAPVLTGPTWQDQDILLRDLWAQGKTPQEIGSILKRSVAAIMTRAARLGLPRRSAPGRKPGSRRPPQEGEIRRTSPRPASNKAQEGENAPAGTSTRICLMCLHPFPSQGRHNRICSACKSSAEYGVAMSLSDINLPV